MKSIRDEVLSSIAKSLKLPVNEIDDSLTLYQLGVDSLEATDLIVHYKERFDLFFDVEEGNALLQLSVKDIIEFLEESVKKRK